MALNKNVEEALNNQVNRELYSAYLYLSMAAYLESINLKGFSHWMRIQVQEESLHATKLFDYIFQRGGRAVMKDIEAPPSDWDSVEDVFSEVYAHEQKVTGLINELVTLSMKENDHASYNMLQWFVAEQVEEEESAKEVIDKLALMGEAPGGLFMLDRELSQRVFNAPQTNEK